ncbi:3-dehydroquinate synthase [Lutibacter sp.]|uniref:3-dehydroquinate synthase n=1 Tax=Lutibacter sp. TaxID=1925666 RepID=UPI0025C00E40|nr:3-dehydroquinate synthase [Lutibacter sp.]MCF6182544.1 3-dehydroquinate synthase [Lutibacter sp.]
MVSILSNNYYVHFSNEGYVKFEEFIGKFKPSKCFILVDENTRNYCLTNFVSKLSKQLTLEVLEIKSGELNKNLETCNFLWEKLTSGGADRRSLLINLGGGVITDMGGFVASTFKRGISFINIPTTLLSMVDASVGGKTGVDLGVLKNQIGLFSNPEMVLIDTNYLETLPPRELLSGLAEIIKYGLTYDIELWHKIKVIKFLTVSNIIPLIYRSIEIKNEVVTKDPRENGVRKILNFGHTLGHAVESYFLESPEKEALTHGEAIAVGMIMELYLSNKLFDFPLNLMNDVKQNIKSLFGNVEISSSDFNQIMELLIHDKKNINGNVNFVLLSAFEECKLNCKVEKSLLIEAFEYYMS